MKTGVQAKIERILAFVVLTSGCSTVEDYSLTYKLWNNGEMRTFAEPAPNPHVAFYADTQNYDVLVQYDEVCEQSDTIRRRAYFLQQNAERVRMRKKPRFVNPQLPTTMNLIPLKEGSSGQTNLAATASLVAAVSSKGKDEFVLVRNGMTEGPYALPTYVASNANFMRVALTPVAVAGDTVMVGLVASFAAAYIYAAGTIHSYQQWH
jgi:hypothetical protein